MHYMDQCVPMQTVLRCLPPVLCCAIAAAALCHAPPWPPYHTMIQPVACENHQRHDKCGPNSRETQRDPPGRIAEARALRASWTNREHRGTSQQEFARAACVYRLGRAAAISEVAAAACRMRRRSAPGSSRSCTCSRHLPSTFPSRQMAAVRTPPHTLSRLVTAGPVPHQAWQLNPCMPATLEPQTAAAAPGSAAGIGRGVARKSCSVVPLFCMSVSHTVSRLAGERG